MRRRCRRRSVAGRNIHARKLSNFIKIIKKIKI